ncbi:MAG: hypothetical protein A2289_19330 [Deltaproteobacteria bacterium RIFOXYA12_FULL_58_15]|nr:MAG: hypothetical protein A2289_19330 [Deltaproteobacteria bacterium RIFOXYA12_FULL_58_15]OGR14478.1 MAG: hypothetical protein A2341_04170 [Deltaproteobacteria bacterium RIFOXYB12_FULL_58_9]
MFELVRKNRNRSIILVTFMMILLAAVGWAAGEVMEPGTNAGMMGIVLALIVGVVLFFVSFFSGSSVLLMSAGAKEIEKKDAPQLYNIVEEMVIASGLGSTPKIYVMESNAANAFATGRKPELSAVAVTEGLLNMLSRDELQAVIAHEIAHVKNRDILFMTLLSVMAGAIALISHFMTRHLFWFGGGRRSRSSSDSATGQAQLILFLVSIGLVILGSITAKLIYFAASRTREYMADAGSAIYTRNPAALASALQKISGSMAGTKLPVPDVARAMLIVGPSLFGTHPPIEKRVAILQALAGTTTLSYAEYARNFQRVTGGAARFMPKSALDEKSVGQRSANAGQKFVERAARTAINLGTAAAGGRLPGVAATAAALAGRATSATNSAPNLRREALDAVKKAAGYEITVCPCGAKIKIPKNYPHRDSIRCLACGRPLGR